MSIFAPLHQSLTVPEPWPQVRRTESLKRETGASDLIERAPGPPNASIAARA
jgi:hypothetical protein